ncbi:hypothetical protein ANANG_G00241090 [Anguilla anguilla]|uniref:B-cell lymphoma 9 beta-catenin binding domain-containing protein n=1 Tax=Anguilla anguilla TaxID=7936 RepID=A0A9D3LV65_ANGAN|nr:hypothetical protein ANANG_G00241090 [Anguilla anguilla]
MHPDSKLTNHGKQVNSGAQSQIPNVSQQQQQHQGPAGSLGSKGVGAGNHGAKPNQIAPGNSGLKSGSVGGGLKGKAKRERSVSADAPDQRDALNPALEPDAKDGVMRSKRRCVLEKKQPYSGDEWCSGADTEEEEEKPPVAPNRELSMAGSVQPLSGPSPIGPISESSGPALGRGAGPGLHSELPRPHEQVVCLVDCIPYQTGPVHLRKAPQPIRAADLQWHSTIRHAQISERHARPASVGGGAMGASAPSRDPDLHRAPESEPLRWPGRGELAAGQRGELGPGNGSGNVGRLSREQLEHRERSLQTLRDIERLLLRWGAWGPGMDDPQLGALHGLPHPHPHLSSPPGPLDMGPLLGPDGLTPEQVAWRKLQEEYYQEKRRQQQDVHPHQHPHPHPHPHPHTPTRTPTA